MIKRLLLITLFILLSPPLTANTKNTNAVKVPNYTESLKNNQISIGVDKLVKSIEGIKDSVDKIQKDEKGVVEKYIYPSLLPIVLSIIAFLLGLFAHDITEKRKRKKEEQDISESYLKIKNYINSLALVPNLPISKWRELVEKIPSGLSADEEVYITKSAYTDLDSVDIPVSRYNDYFVELGLVKIRILNEMVRKHLKKTETHISDNHEELVYVSESISHLLQSVDELNEKKKILDFNHEDYIEKRESIASDLAWYINSVTLRLRTMKIIKSSVFTRTYNELPEL